MMKGGGWKSLGLMSLRASVRSDALVSEAFEHCLSMNVPPASSTHTMVYLSFFRFDGGKMSFDSAW
jgi:hypothetical protein